MQNFGIGQNLARLEDDRLLTGRGCYTDDLHLEGEAHAIVLRSEMAHAAIKDIDREDALELNGILAVLTARDLEEDGISAIPCVAGIDAPDGTAMFNPGRPVLAADRVRHVGEPVAFVVAETREAAEAAAESISIDYEPLDAVISLDDAVAGEGPEIWPGHQNHLFTYECGDADQTAEAFEKADQIVRLRLVNNRVAPSSIEVRGAIGEYDDEDGYTLYAGTQGASQRRDGLAHVLDVEPDRVRVVTRDVGGGFGMRAFLYPEDVLVAVAAKRLGRPVRWIGKRSDAFGDDTHGRDLIVTGELAIDSDGNFLALRYDGITNMGGSLSGFAPFIQTMSPIRVLTGPYRIPVVYKRLKGVFTNTSPVDAYRGAGRPESNYMLERLVDAAAVAADLTQAEIRRRNFIPADSMPYKTATGSTYDSGEFQKNMEDAMERAGWRGFAERREKSEADGKLRGIGMAYYVENTLGPPVEEVEVNFTAGGRIEVWVGTQSTGQGHETAFAQIMASKLGVPVDFIQIKQGDTARKESGGGTGGSRSLQMAGNATSAATDEVIARGRKLTAHLFDADEEDVEFNDGAFAVKGTNQRIAVLELAEELRGREGLPDGLADGLNAKASYSMEAPTYPNGCHIAEIEIDPDTGATSIIRYTVVDDFGVIVNPMIVAGQVHGGVVQGVGQAIHEHVLYDKESGQLLTGSFMDYGLPRADDMSGLDFSYNEIPCETNPMGVKGCGEAGTIGALPATINALLDALRPQGVKDIDMPATPMAIWSAMRAAKQGQDAAKSSAS